MEHASLPLSPLNVLLGPNSSGKSSLIQSLLLLAQSTEDEIILNGPLVRLGDPADVIRTGCDSVAFGFVVKGQVRGETTGYEILFEIVLADQDGNLNVSEFVAIDQQTSSILVSATSDRVPASVADSLRESRSHQAVLRVREIDGRAAPSYTFLVFNGFIPVALGFRRSRKDVFNELKRTTRRRTDVLAAETGFDTYIQLLEWLSQDPDNAPEGYRTVISSGRRTGELLDFFLELSRTELRQLLEAFVEANHPEEEWVRVPASGFAGADGFRGAVRQFPPLDPRRDGALRIVSFGAQALRIFQGNIRYLGPLREEPQVVSPTGARYRALPSGAKGEYTADLFARSKDSEVRYFDWNGKQRRESLQNALTRWVAHLGLGEDVSVEDQGKLGRGLRIRVNGADRDLTTIGVGASQLLPVLAVVLTASPGNIMLLEQPELHLHPSVQSRLADFFLYARPTVRIIVESHSEYMVTRLRRRVVDDPKLIERIAVLFAEQHSGVTEIRRLRLDRLGDFSDWPEGFFDTQDYESTELVKAVRRAMELGRP